MSSEADDQQVQSSRAARPLHSRQVHRSRNTCVEMRQALCAVSSICLPFLSSPIEIHGSADGQPEALSSASPNPFKPNNAHAQTLVTSQPTLLNMQDDTSKEDVIFF